ncbi:MAG: 4-(cytidine 5'-diphospho)-2-C-methyl-D-erythritol kinase [Sphingosinicella sp.]
MQETAYAKLNLALHVRARRPDGYHEIETIFAFCDDGDLIEAQDNVHLCWAKVQGPMASALEGGGHDLVNRAAESISRERGMRPDGAIITLTKNLPVAAGLGGGSADAAATLRVLDRLWRLRLGVDRLQQLAADLGADVPACLHSRMMRGEGRGDRLTPVDLPELTGKPLLLVNPGRSLSTRDVFAGWGGEDRGPLGNDWSSGRNDLQPIALRLVPEIADVLTALAGAEIARMSGSGPTCFGLYASTAGRDRAAAGIAAAHPDWWLLATRLR